MKRRMLTTTTDEDLRRHLKRLGCTETPVLADALTSR
jgi:hypothetical protein